MRNPAKNKKKEGWQTLTASDCSGDGMTCLLFWVIQALTIHKQVRHSKTKKYGMKCNYVPWSPIKNLHKIIRILIYFYNEIFCNLKGVTYGTMRKMLVHSKTMLNSDDDKTTIEDGI